METQTIIMVAVVIMMVLIMQSNQTQHKNKHFAWEFHGHNEKGQMTYPDGSLKYPPPF